MKKILTLLGLWWHCTRQPVPQWVLFIENAGVGRRNVFEKSLLRAFKCVHFLEKLVGWGLVQGDQWLAVDISCFCLIYTVNLKLVGQGLYSNFVVVVFLSCICLAFVFCIFI